MKRRSWPARVVATFLVMVLLSASAARVEAYSVLAHEAIIDAAWNISIRPLLLHRFPRSTPEELKAAHAYAYGGAIIQDLGYYPHGSHFFSDLTHYVRSGDFILALLRDSKDLNGYAFALGAFHTTAADNDGHRLGTNPSVPILYPKLEKKYGNYITYEQDPLAHVKTEFGFDVLEVAKQRYAPDSYHDFIGFEVDAPLLEQAFQETYGLKLRIVLDNEEKALGILPASGQQTDSPGNPRWLVAEKRRNHARPAEHDEEKISLQSLTRELREGLGQGLSKADTCGRGFWRSFTRFCRSSGRSRVLQLRTPTPQTEHMFEAASTMPWTATNRW